MSDAHREPASAIGVDVGGTKVAGGLVNPQGEISHFVRVPMNPRGSASEGFSAVAAVLESVFQKTAALNGTVRIGVCAPGPLDPMRGVVLNPPNVPCWKDFPLTAEIQQRYGISAKLDNDANAAALAESLWGAGRDFSNVFYACIGTGIGTGIVIDRKSFHGRTGSAAEGGHVSIDYRGPICNCGKKGCIEALASGTAIARRAREAILRDQNQGAQLLAIANGDIAEIRSETVGAAASAGDPLARQVLSETLEFLAIWLGTIVDLLEPDVMILGGGVSEMLHPHFDELKSRMKNWCVNARYGEIPLVSAHYRENSGVAGAAALCWTQE